MVSQEDLFRFFQSMSEELYSNGYPILDNIIHPFPNIQFEEEIIKREVRNSNESDNSISSGEEETPN